MGTKTKVYTSSMAGAPVLSGTAGTLIAVLDAVLVNGFGQLTATSVTVASGVATVNFATTHAFDFERVALVTGATPAALNGEKRVLSRTTNAFTFDAVGVPDGAATGTITVKVAPAGWQKLHAGTNLGAYKSLSPEATGCVLRVDDTNTTFARVRGYESMTDVNTGLGLFPTDAQMNGGFYWSKSNSASTAARGWVIVADDRAFYWFSRSVDQEYQADFFGDFLSIKSGDVFGCALQGKTSNRASTTSLFVDDLAAQYSDVSAHDSAGLAVARMANAIGGSTGYTRVFAGVPMSTLGTMYSGNQSGNTYPSDADNGLHVSPMALIRFPQGLRGFFPGFLVTNQACGISMTSLATVLGSGLSAGKKLLCLRTSYAGPTYVGAVFFDYLTDWRT